MNSLFLKRAAWFFSAILTMALLYFFDPVQEGVLERSVSHSHPLPFLETRWLYMGLLAFTLSFPLIFGFLPQLRFDRHWLRFFKANLPVTAFFIVWDVWFTRMGVWGFSDRYTIGVRFSGLPLEEWLFFIVVPAACVFIYYSLQYFFPRPLWRRHVGLFTLLLAILLFIWAGFNWTRIYTATASVVCGLLLLYHYFNDKTFLGWFYAAYLLSCIPFLLVNGALTGGFTQSPVVMYNPEEYCGYRCWSVPCDDFIYSMAMLLGNIALFEKKHKHFLK